MKVWANNSGKCYFSEKELVEDNKEKITDILINYLGDNYFIYEIFTMSETKKEECWNIAVSYYIENNCNIYENSNDISFGKEARSIEELEIAPIETMTIQEVSKFCQAKECNNCRLYDGYSCFFEYDPCEYEENISKRD